ncbi:MAG TPA: hypothetical protein VMH23_09815 [Bacteroidota bacterium]|nr:hypothetical protein [Bacteroidota bacterium]
MKKTIAVIGAAKKMGSTISFGLAAAAYCVLVTDDIEKSLTPFFGALPILLAKIRFKVPYADVRIVFSAREACWEADIIILADESDEQAGVARRIKDVVTQKIVIGVTDALGTGVNGQEKAASSNTIEELARLLPYSKIVHLFTPSSPVDSARLQDSETHPVVLVGGEDQEAVSTVMLLAQEVGLNPLIADNLNKSNAGGDDVRNRRS